MLIGDIKIHNLDSLYFNIVNKQFDVLVVKFFGRFYDHCRQNKVVEFDRYLRLI